MDTSAPLKPAAFHILLALAERDSYGYAILQAVREQSGGRVALQTGSFYRHLTRLIADRLVVEVPPPRMGDDPRRGAYYRLTPLGRRALEREREYLAAMMATLGGLRATPRKGHA